MAVRAGDRINSALGKHGYTQVKKVGEGSFGAAILVSHERAEGKFIIKMVDISRASKAEKDDALKESQVLSSLKHPYIVRYRESFLEDGWLCIAMDYCEGGDLSDRLKKAKTSNRIIAEEQLVRWFTQAVLALKYIHDKHILHRDLKAGNFFLSKAGNLKMGDFGIAKVLECTAAQAQTQIGTPYYLSPEICQGKPYSWSSDIWSMGIILYEMCARRVPFDAPDLKTLIQRITKGPTPDLPSEYSPELRQLGRLLLNRDPAQRPQTGDVLKHPIVQNTVKKMLAEVKDEEAAADDSRGGAAGGGGERSRSSGGGQRAEPRRDGPDPASAGTYTKGELVEYYSETHNEWLPATVTAMDAAGRAMLNVKPNVWLSLEIQQAKVRPRAGQASGGGGGRPPPSGGAPPLGSPSRPSEQRRPESRGGGGGGGAGGRPPAAAEAPGRQASPMYRGASGGGGSRGASPRHRDAGGAGGMRRDGSRDGRGGPDGRGGQDGRGGPSGREPPVRSGSRQASPFRAAAGTPSRGASADRGFR